MSNPTTIEPKKRTLIFINIIITCIASSMLEIMSAVNVILILIAVFGVKSGKH